MTGTLPALFLSHGAPSLVLEDCPARDFLAGLGQALPRAEAIIVMSAHYETDHPAISTTPKPDTIHDFRGFPDALHAMQYPAPGAPEIAHVARQLLDAAGYVTRIDPERGLDHGIWAPLALVYPKADIPVVPLSIQPHEGPDHHAAIGRALSPLRDAGILLIGSGSITHNLSRFFGGEYRLDSPAEPFAREFADWIAGRIEAGDTDALLSGPGSWPAGCENHPTDDHILPLYFALGAGGTPLRGQRLHRSTNYGVLAMDAFAFG